MAALFLNLPRVMRIASSMGVSCEEAFVSSLDAAWATSICIASPSPAGVGRAVASELGKLASAGEFDGWATRGAGGGAPAFVGSCNWLLVGLGGAHVCC